MLNENTDSGMQEFAELSTNIKNLDMLLHELKQPLLCVMILAERLENQIKNIDANSVPKQPIMHRDIKSLLVSVNRLKDQLGLKSALGSFYYLESKWQQGFEELCESFKALATARKVDLCFNFCTQEQETGPDFRTLGQIVNNIILNGIEALEFDNIKEKKILIESSIERYSQGDFIKIQIHDSGSGIAGDMLEKIFEKGLTTKAWAGGTGTGLWLSKKIANLLGGRLSAEVSPILGGACFVLLVPVKSKQNDVVSP